MNSCDFVGQFKYDPTLKTYDKPNGGETLVTNFVLEISRIFRKKNGEEREQSYCLDFEAWDVGAKLIAENFHSGDWISIHSSAKVDSYLDKNTGDMVNRVRFRVNEFEIPKWNTSTVPTGVNS
jgi:single-stranded DNA-binding protein